MKDNRRVDFADLRARADFRTVLAHYGIAIKGSGDQVKALCPLHDDERPSLSINLCEKVFHCYAPSCPGHDGGDIIAFVHLIETHRGSSGSLRQAGITLAAICGLDTAGGTAPPRRQEGRRSTRRRERAPNHGPCARRRSWAAGGGGNGHYGAQSTVQPHAHARSGASVPERARGQPRGRRRVRAGLVPRRKDHTRSGLHPDPQRRGRARRLCRPLGRSGRRLPEDEDKYKLPRGSRSTSSCSTSTGSRTAGLWSSSRGSSAPSGCTASRVPTVALMGGSISEEQVALLREHCPSLRFVTVCLDPEPGRGGRARRAHGLALVGARDRTGGRHAARHRAEADVLALLGRA